MRSLDLSPRGINNRLTIQRSYGERMTTLAETVFAGMPTQSFTNGQTFVQYNGLSAVCSIPSGGSVAIVSDGLKVNHPTSSSSEVAFYYPAPMVSKVVGAARWRRGRWACWTRIAAASTTWQYVMGFDGNYPAHGFNIRKRTAGLFGGYWLGSEVDTQLRGTSSGANVACMYWRSPYSVEYLYGNTVNGAWPDFESLTLGGMVNGAPSYANARNVDSFLLNICGGGYSGNTANYMTVAGWRITTWD